MRAPPSCPRARPTCPSWWAWPRARAWSRSRPATCWWPSARRAEPSPAAPRRPPRPGNRRSPPPPVSARRRVGRGRHLPHRRLQRRPAGQRRESAPLTKRWTRDLGYLVQDALLADGQVFAAAGPYLFALDAATGADVWAPVALGPPAHPLPTRLRRRSRLRRHRQRAAAGVRRRHRGGAVVDASPDDWLTTPPVYADGLVYTMSHHRPAGGVGRDRPGGVDRPRRQVARPPTSSTATSTWPGLDAVAFDAFTGAVAWPPAAARRPAPRPSRWVGCGPRAAGGDPLDLRRPREADRRVRRHPPRLRRQPLLRPPRPHPQGQGPRQRLHRVDVPRRRSARHSPGRDRRPGLRRVDVGPGVGPRPGHRHAGVGGRRRGADRSPACQRLGPHITAGQGLVVVPASTTLVAFEPVTPAPRPSPGRWPGLERLRPAGRRVDGRPPSAVPMPASPTWSRWRPGPTTTCRAGRRHRVGHRLERPRPAGRRHHRAADHSGAGPRA